MRSRINKSDMVKRNNATAYNLNIKIVDTFKDHQKVLQSNGNYKCY